MHRARTRLVSALLFILISAIVSSCGTTSDVASNGLIQKRKHRNGWHVNATSSPQKRLEKQKKTNQEGIMAAVDNPTSSKEYNDHIKRTTYSASLNDQDAVLELGNTQMSSLARAAVRQLSNRIAKNDFDESDCDEIIMNDGSIISAKVTEIAVNEIKYKKCDNESGPVYSVLKSDVFMVKYSNGSTDVFGTSNTSATQTESQTKTSSALVENDNPSPPGTDPLALFSILFALAGLLIGLALSVGVGFLFGVVAIIFGAVSLNRINKYPEKYGGKGTATFGLVSGILVAGLMLAIWAIIVALII